jgi:hypothetical protein
MAAEKAVCDKFPLYVVKVKPGRLQHTLSDMDIKMMVAGLKIVNIFAVDRSFLTVHAIFILAILGLRLDNRTDGLVEQLLRVWFGQ